MGLVELLGQFKQVRDDLAGGKFASALKDTAPILTTLGDLAAAVGFKAGPGDDVTKAEILACCDDCIKLCTVPLPMAGPEEVGKIGDGSLLKLLFEFALKILPLVL